MYKIPCPCPAQGGPVPGYGGLEIAPEFSNHALLPSHTSIIDS
jgi:hypothetical protein